MTYTCGGAGGYGGFLPPARHWLLVPPVLEWSVGEHRFGGCGDEDSFHALPRPFSLAVAVEVCTQMLTGKSYYTCKTIIDVKRTER